jgi:hypothetical protein
MPVETIAKFWVPPVHLAYVLALFLFFSANEWTGLCKPTVIFFNINVTSWQPLMLPVISVNYGKCRIYHKSLS